jgi:hypothetical protein
MPHTIRVPGKKLRVDDAIVNSRSKYVILVDGAGDLTFPDPATSKLVAISALVEEYVSGHERQLTGLTLRHPDGGDIGQVDSTSLNIRDSKVGDFGKRWI